MTRPTLDDRAALFDLAATYAASVDGRRTDDLIALFLPDAVIQVPPDSTFDRERLAAGVLSMGAKHLATHHMLGQQTASVDGDVATTETYCVAQHLYEEDGERWNRVMNIRYQDECRRVDGAWRFARRRLEVDWTEVRRA